MTPPATTARPPLRNRAAFARAIATVKPGMTTAKVEQILGAPDDTITEADPGGISASRTHVVWRYGTSAHRGFATLGTIHIQADDTVQYVFGATGAPPAGFAEAELRTLLERVAAVSSYNDTLEPLTLVQAVNALVPLGKGRALAVIDELLRVSSPFDDKGREGVFLLDRALFDVPASGVMPPMMVGGPDVATPADPKALPRMPLVIIGDIPLKLVGGYMLGGHPQQPESDVDWFRANGTIRRTPMTPPAHPLDVVDAYVNGPLATLVKLDDNLRARLYDQTLRLVGTAYRPMTVIDGWFPYGANVAARWAAVRAEVAKASPTWNAATSRYTKPDGSTVPAPVHAWQRVWWDLGLANTTVSRATFERVADDRVDIELRFELAAGSSIAPGFLRILDPAGHELVKLPIGLPGSPGSTSGQVSGQHLSLPAHTKLRLQLVQGSAVKGGPELTP